MATLTCEGNIWQTKRLHGWLVQIVMPLLVNFLYQECRLGVPTLVAECGLLSMHHLGENQIIFDVTHGVEQNGTQSLK